MTSIVLDQIEKRFGPQTALHPSSLKVAEGEFVVLVGPSGCGKTTLLRIIAGLEDATSGSIWMGSEEVTWLEAKNRGVGMVFQNYALYPHLTVEGNLAYPLNILKLPRDEKQRRIQEAAKLLDIENLLKRKPAELSGGQQQRVAIGRALVRQPRIFLFDEPLSNLDARLREQMRLEVAALHKRLGRTTIYVTHDQHEAMTLGDRLVVMNQGRIIQTGTPLELYHNPNSLFVAKFMGNPPMNLFRGRAFVTREKTEQISTTFQGSFGTIRGLSVPQREEKELILAIRPEELSITDLNQQIEEPPLLVGSVCLIEQLGRESHIQVEVGDQRVWAIANQTGLRLGSQVSITLSKQDRLYWFTLDGVRIME